ncbi:MAG: hypothetical protein GY810_12700 [Aureispira sp.]|nr:hypothetical protein [Aureispira sp.]
MLRELLNQKPHRPILIAVFLMFLGLGFAQVDLIPSWRDTGDLLLLSIFCTAAIVLLFWIVYSISQYKKVEGALYTAFSGLIVLLTVVPTLFMITIFLSGTGGLFPPQLRQTISIDDKTFYVYEIDCYLSTICECKRSNYKNWVYEKNNYLPIMHERKSVGFSIGKVYKKDNKILIEESDDKSEDYCNLSKTKLRIVEL